MAATTNTLRRPLETFHRAHRGSNVHRNSSEPNVGIPFHGSCSRCHHFHNNHLFTFSLNSTIHTRLFCERCNHPMFGLGRVSTQTTLASVESDSAVTPGACVDQQGLQPASQAEPVPGTPRLGQGLLTTIAERRSPATSRSTSHIDTPAPTLAASLAGEEPVESRVWPKDLAQGSPEGPALKRRTATLRRLRTIGRRFKRHFYGKPREWNLSRIGLHITITTESHHDAPDPSGTPLVRPIVSDTHRIGLTGDRSALASASTIEAFSGQRRSSNAEELVEGTEYNTEDRYAPLRARRRALTLVREREAESMRKCECSPECPCISGSHVVQVSRADTPENILVPEYLFPCHHSSTGSSCSQRSQIGTQGLDFLHIGGRFDSPQRSSSVDESSSAESGPRRIRLSQGSTLWSNGSSVSLRARRASSMPVGNRAQYLAGGRTGSHTNSSVQASGWPETARTPSSLDEGSIPRRIRRTESSRNDEVPSYESSTSLANIPDPQEEEQLVDGVSPASHTPMRDGYEVLPTPHNGILLNGGSDSLSSDLQDLVNREITDHEGHSPEL